MSKVWFSLNKAKSTLFILVALFSSLALVGSASADGQLGAWNSTTDLPTSLSNVSSVVNNGYIYELGGYGNSGYSNTVYYAQQNSDGTVGPWNTATSLPIGVDDATAVVNNGYVYLIGGYDNSGASDATYYAAINSDGTLGAWTTTASLPYGISAASSVVNDGYIYELAGYGTTGISDNVYYAAINSDGTLGAWTATTVLPDVLGYATSVVNNGYIYEIGGYDNSSTTSTVYYAPINSDGSVGAWSTTTSMPITLADASSVVSDGYVYEIGGYSDSYGLEDAVNYAPINSDGTVGAWNSTSALPNYMDASSSVVSNGYVYEIGGNYGSDDYYYLDSVYYATIPTAPVTTPPSSSSPSSTIPTITTISSTNPVGAPDTGFGVSPSNSMETSLILGASALGTAGAAIVSRKMLLKK